jgi:2'-5' RNA ligase
MKNRLFLAIPALIDDYEAVQRAFSGAIRGHWIPPEKLHLTLSFFGTAFEQEALIEGLSSLSFDLQPSPIRGFGYFARNRVFYANVENPALEELYKQVNSLFEIPTKRGFVGHVTMMRFKEILDQDRLDEQLTLSRDEEVGRLETHPLLMASELHPEGAIYSVLKRF